MIRISYLMRRLPHLSLEEFQSYWSEKHPQAAPADAFATLGVKRYVQVLPIESTARDLVIGPRTGLEDTYDGIAELWVDDLDAIERDWSTEKAKEYIGIFFEDEKNFIDWTRSTILVSNENVVM
ncbi:MAG: EthD domain-containing protein [Planctomycetota bacterium]